MVRSTEETDNLESPPEKNLSREIRALIDGLREDVQALRDEVQALRRNQTLNGPDALLTREEAAKRLSISTRTLDDMAKSGEIQPVPIRGRVLYHPKTLEAYVRRKAGGGCA
jgi:excisionase family DNA binding protein